MAGEVDELVAAWAEIKSLNHELAHTADLAERAAIQDRIAEITERLNQACEAIKRDAAEGDREARVLLDWVETFKARKEE